MAAVSAARAATTTALRELQQSTALVPSQQHHSSRTSGTSLLSWYRQCGDAGGGGGVRQSSGPRARNNRWRSCETQQHFGAAPVTCSAGLLLVQPRVLLLTVVINTEGVLRGLFLRETLHKRVVYGTS